MWAGASYLNALIFVALPATGATSRARPLVGWITMASVALSVLLTVAGLTLWWLGRAHPTPPRRSLALLAAALPVCFVGLLWIVGPFS